MSLETLSATWTIALVVYVVENPLIVYDVMFCMRINVGFMCKGDVMIRVETRLGKNIINEKSST